MKNTFLLTTLSLSIVAGAALSAGSGHGADRHGPRPTFEELDANGDGALTKTEMEAHVAQRFNAADTDGNGQIDKAELRARLQDHAAKKIDKRVEHILERRDANGDGQLSRDEMKPGRMAGLMSRADKDGDGALSRAEFEAMKAKHRYKAHRKS